MFKKLGKLNNFAMLAIGIVYSIILFIVIYSIVPKRRYAVIPDFDHITGYSEIEPMFQYIPSYTVKDGVVNLTSSVRYTLVSNTNENELKESYLNIIKVSPYVLTKNDTNYYMTEQSNKQAPYGCTSSLADKYTPKAIYFNVRYFDEKGNDSTATFKEDVLETPTSTRKFGEDNLISVGDSTFKFQAIKEAAADGPNYPMHVVINTTKHYHADLQTWLVTESGDIYPFVGVYGITQTTTWTTSSAKVPANLKAKTLLARLIVYIDGEKYETSYKTDLSALPSAYYDFIDHEAVNNKNLWLYISIPAAVIIAGGVSYYIIRKRKKTAEN